MKFFLMLILSICLLSTACTKNKQSESSVSLYEHILDIGDDIQIMSDSNNQVLITKFSENKQIVIICDADNERYMSQSHCARQVIDLFVNNCKVYDKQIEWVGVLESGAESYASKTAEEYDEYYKKTFTRVYTTYDSLYGWLNK